MVLDTVNNSAVGKGKIPQHIHVVSFKVRIVINMNIQLGYNLFL